MDEGVEAAARVVRAVHALREIKPDEPFELGLAERLRSDYGAGSIVDLYQRFAVAEGSLDFLMRRAIWRAVARRLGNGVSIGAGVGFKHLETFEIGDGVFIGSQSYLQGRFDGRFVVGSHVWIGPQSYFDARDLVLEDWVGWGPGAKVLGSAHTGMPIGIPIIQTDLEIKPVRIGMGADIGTNAVILPGVTIGQGSVVGAGAVVASDVPAYSVVAGVPARFLRWREGHERSNG